MTLWCCRSKDRAGAKRCSYTAIAFARNPTSSGTVNSGNSLRQDPNQRHSTRRQDSCEKNFPIVHVCHNGKSFVSPPIHNCRNNYKHHHHHHHQNHVAKEQPSYNRNLYLDTPICVSYDRRSPCSPVCCTYPSSPTETVTVSPEAIIPDEKREYLNDEPEKYLKEIKSRIIQKEKEYR